MDHRFTFERPGSRNTCPACGHKKEFTRYVDLENGELLPEHVGRCNRRDKCGYHYSVKDYLQDNQIPETSKILSTLPRPTKRETSFLSRDLLDASLADRGSNFFIDWLRSILPGDTVKHQIERYHIGTALRPWKGSSIFWQVDTNGKIRAGKVMLYNPVNGKRVKDPIDHFSWIHSLLMKAGKLSEFNLQQCLFGEHLIGTADKIAIVESEKTAILASVYFPQFTWIASGGLCNLTREKARVLSGKNVFLFPDKGCYNEWTKRANEIREFARVELSNYLEQLPGRPDGYDLADLLTEPNQVDKLADGTEIKLHPGGFPADWAA